MFDWSVLAMAVVVGVAVAAPIGPINLMAIRNTLAGGFWLGVFTGLGAVLGDGTFAAIAAFGITAVSALVQDHAVWIHSVGGVILIVVGLYTAASSPTLGDRRTPVGTGRALSLVGTTYVLTVTNPATMMGFIAIFGGFGGLLAQPGYAMSALIVAAVMCGSLLWWIVVSWLASLLRERMAERVMRYANRTAGGVIALFGAVVLIRIAFA